MVFDPYQESPALYYAVNGADDWKRVAHAKRMPFFGTWGNSHFTGKSVDDGTNSNFYFIGPVMKFPGTISRGNDGQWVARHESRELGAVQASAPTREQAIEKLCGEVRYRLELCPCSGEAYRDVKIEITDA